MGLTAVTEDMQHLLQHSRETKKVRVHVFTETKLVPKQHYKKWLQNIFHEWDVHYSSKEASGTQVKHHYHRQGSAGIIIACPKACEFGCFERLQDVPVHLSGHLLIMKNSTASIIIAGVYMPCEDTELRKGIYEYLSGMARKAETDKTTLVMAGDWNAAWTDLDRPNGVLSAVDKRHQKAMEQMRMCPAQAVQRSMTYGVLGMGNQSRIDDIFLQSSLQLEVPPSENVLAIGERSDHLPLQINLHITLSAAPNAEVCTTERSKTVPTVKRPLTPGQRQMLQTHLESVSSRDVHSFAGEIGEVYNTAKNLHASIIGSQELSEPASGLARKQFEIQLAQQDITACRVENLAAFLMKIIERMNAAALEVLPAVPDRNKRRSFRPRQMVVLISDYAGKELGLSGSNQTGQRQMQTRHRLVCRLCPLQKLQSEACLCRMAKKHTGPVISKQDVK